MLLKKIREKIANLLNSGQLKEKLLKYKESQKVLNKILCRLYECQMAGVSISDYLTQKGIHSVYIYAQKGFWSVANLVCLNIINNRHIRILGYISNKPFKRSLSPGRRLPITFAIANEATIARGHTILCLSKSGRCPSLEDGRIEDGLTLLDFNSILSEMENYAYWNKPLEDFHNAHPEVKIVTLRLPSHPKTNLSEHESYVIKNNVKRNYIACSIRLKQGRLSHVWDDADYSDEDLLTMLESPPYYHNNKGILSLSDTRSKFVNIVSGHRITTEVPEIYERTVYLFGGCRIFGIGVPDACTLASKLQHLFISHKETEKTRVENYGTFLRGHYADFYPIINSIKYKPGDVAVIWAPAHTDHHPFAEDVDLVKLFARPHNYGEVFYDHSHYSEKGYEICAKALQNEFTNRGILDDTAPILLNSSPEQNGDSPSIEEEYAEELVVYKNEINKYRGNDFEKAGAIVMNCNPFTLGHRYLIEYASKIVDKLFIFVVSEDKSFFPFDDRINLVRQGTSDVQNVTVLPSGKFIISQITFTDYFGKAELQDRVIDTSQDVSLFGKHIASALNISIRFVGEEPFDNVTRQYNQTLRELLPEFGVEVVVIPRKESSGEAISASRVRALLKERDFNSLENLVPKTTLDYLFEKFSD